MLISIELLVLFCHDTIPSLESCRYVTVVEITCQLLDGEGCGDLQSFCPCCVTTVTKKSSHLYNNKSS